MPTIDPIRAAAEAAAHATLCDLLRAQMAAGAPCSIAVANDLFTVTVTVAPTRGRLSLDRVERDILAVLAAAGIPLPTSQVMAELARRGLDHAEITVKRRLARLVKAGVILSRTHPPRGYCLPGDERRLPE